MAKKDTNSLAAEQTKLLLSILKARFENNMNRQKGNEWANAKEIFSSPLSIVSRF